MDSEQKRLYLRVTAKLMSLLFLIGLGVTFLSSLPGPEVNHSDSLYFDLSEVRAGQSARLQWGQKRIIVLRRERVPEETRKALEAELADPDSKHSSQPGFAENPYRSRDPHYFVALDYGTDLNCQLDYVGQSGHGPEGMLWQGGLHDRCRGSWYDDAGRVYKGQKALRNLTVPNYRIEGKELILGGE